MSGSIQYKEKQAPIQRSRIVTWGSDRSDDYFKLSGVGEQLVRETHHTHELNSDWGGKKRRFNNVDLRRISRCSRTILAGEQFILKLAIFIFSGVGFYVFFVLLKILFEQVSTLGDDVVHKFFTNLVGSEKDRGIVAYSDPKMSNFVFLWNEYVCEMGEDSNCSHLATGIKMYAIIYIKWMNASVDHLIMGGALTGLWGFIKAWGKVFLLFKAQGVVIEALFFDAKGRVSNLLKTAGLI